MSEMLGNQYFMVRKYFDAKTEYENELIKYPANKSILKKLIICLTQTGEVQKALDHFYKLAITDIEYIIDTDPVRDDCPCVELIEQLKKSIGNYKNVFDEQVINGILWGYCDITNSIQHFEKAALIDRSNRKITEIIDVMNQYISKSNTLIQLN